ncbi:MAG: dTMP kinase [Synergistaceae bacterium]|jgi:dTMP kinase|nr:dTMP kinase [Synergistaceae bacterium]
MFFVLEGIDGSGKTTQADRLAEMLARRLGPDNLIRTREPGGWEGSAAAREFVLGGGLASLWGEFFFFMLDRCEHVERVIKPALSQGKTVLSDRYAPSTLAYQIFSDTSIDSAAAEYAARLGEVIGLPTPDAVFFLDVDPGTAASRLASRGVTDSFDGRGREFCESVRTGYEKTKAAWSGRWVDIDASRDEEAVARDIEAEVSSMLTAAQR